MHGAAAQSAGCTRDTQNYTRQISRETIISRRLVGRITKTYSAKVPEETSHAGVNYVEHSVVEQAIDQWRERLNACVEAKGKHFEHFVVDLNNTLMTTSRPWQVLGRLKGEMIHPER